MTTAKACKMEYLLKFIQEKEMDLPSGTMDAILRTFHTVINGDLQKLYDELTSNGRNLFIDFQKASYGITLPENHDMDDMYIKGFFEGMRGYWLFIRILEAAGLLNESNVVEVKDHE
ncbi:hypothetical protein DCC39_07500 [Pueribacillus theae]|uniref:Uncharacterized protein n=1 Tax=Pueribacillus theae TaxID=2171751 RepID=A0A2U1K3J2_9BACI|nr:hypothetical protein [Pueribacillus theae]PWA12086.1 hypothetical protein DCC39_07500 [Pueribacillus theae]